MHGLQSRWSVALLTMLLAVFAFAAACEDEDEPVAEEIGTETPTETATETPTEEVTETPTEEASPEGDEGEEGDDEAASTLAADVTELEGSGVTGTVNIEENEAGELVVDVELSGLPEGPHANHIHVGSCEEQGDIVIPLTELEAAADGSATATTTVTESDLATLAEGHYYQVHAEGDDAVGPGIGCGNLQPAAG